MTAAVIAGLLAGYGIAIPIGAVGTYLVALTARTSLWVGAAAALGVATVDGAYALVAVTGGAALSPVIEPAAGVLRWVSAVVLLAMAVQTTVSAIRRYRTTRTEQGQRRARAMTPARAYPALVAMTVVNPTTVVYFTALVLGGHSGFALGWADRAAFVVAAFVASASWQLLLAGGGALLGRAVAGRRRQLGTALVSSALVVVLAVRVVLG